MAIIRSDNEADGVEILKLIIETTDYYRSMAELLAEDNLEAAIAEIAGNRESFIAPFQEVVKQLGELPARPDPDKELMQKIGGELTKFFSADAKNAILDKCLHEDDKLADLVRRTALGEQSAAFQQKLDALADNLNDTKKVIQALKD
ncbi:hypothetical protein [Arsukibacterium sp.]|uniref:hypothetical protein n=1 Tax=Arsukibacterium sp. TaxID=1977258 RepID=UPI001BD6A2E5|nr:hypothetical protein [Arsukibacterium sp.]